MNVIATGTLAGWYSFLLLRLVPTVQPEMYILAGRIAQEIIKWQDLNLFQLLRKGEWHIPFATPHLEDYRDQLVHSVACCARVSYGNAMIEADLEKDSKLYDTLLDSKHLSPFEHQARIPHSSSYHDLELGRNFGCQWNQYRALSEKPNHQSYDIRKAVKSFESSIDNSVTVG